MMKLKYIVLLAVLAIAAVCTTPCQGQDSLASAEVKKDTTKVFQKVLFFVMVKDDATRRIAEDKLVKELKGRGVASYKYPGTTVDETSETVLSDRLKQDGFDGLVLMRLATVDKNKQPAPGNTASPNNSWYGYYTTTLPGFSNPNNYPMGNVYNVQINVYSLATDKLLWTGVTSAVNTSNTDKMVDQIITTTKQKMKSQGLIK